MSWVLVVYFMIASQPATEASQIHLLSEEACLKAAEKVTTEFAQFWATKRWQNRAKIWENSRKRAGKKVPSPEELGNLITGKINRIDFEDRYGLGSAAFYIGPSPHYTAEDLRLAKSNIFTVCLPVDPKKNR